MKNDIPHLNWHLFLMINNNITRIILLNRVIYQANIIRQIMHFNRQKDNLHMELAKNMIYNDSLQFNKKSYFLYVKLHYFQILSQFMVQILGKSL